MEPLELELQVVTGCPLLVLGPSSNPLEQQVMPLSREQSLQTQIKSFKLHVKEEDIKVQSFLITYYIQ